MSGFSRSHRRYTYPTTQCTQVQNGKLRLIDVPFSGADLTISSAPNDAWPFMAVGQLLTIEVAGVSATTGGDVSVLARDNKEVVGTEFNSKRIAAKIEKRFLEGLKRDTSFTLKARVSFDGGETYKEFNYANPILTA